MADAQLYQQNDSDPAPEGNAPTASDTCASACAEVLPHPAQRALELAQGLHFTFRPGASNIAFLLKLWRDRCDAPLTDKALSLIASLAATDAPQPPITREEVAALIVDLKAFFPAIARQRMRAELRAYLTLRGATGEQLLRADVKLRDAIGQDDATNQANEAPTMEQAA